MVHRHIQLFQNWFLLSQTVLIQLFKVLTSQHGRFLLVIELSNAVNLWIGPPQIYPYHRTTRFYYAPPLNKPHSQDVDFWHMKPHWCLIILVRWIHKKLVQTSWFQKRTWWKRMKYCNRLIFRLCLFYYEKEGELKSNFYEACCIFSYYLPNFHEF